MRAIEIIERTADGFCAIIGGKVREHECDADCAPFIDADGQCSVCGVSSGDPCPECGGTSFHKSGCSEI
jgi:hypothetical protein